MIDNLRELLFNLSVTIRAKAYEVPIFVPRLPLASKILPYWESIDVNGWYSNFGPLSVLLEERLAERIGLDKSHVVTIVNATLALQGAVATVPKTSLWSCPSWTFAATAHSIIGAQKKLKLLDVNEDWRMDLGSSTSEHKNFVDVLPFGDSIDLNRFSSGIDNLIIDAAGSFDSIQNLNLPIGFPTGIVMSFHPTKALAGGEGALFISNDTEWVARMRRWANFGFDEDRTAITDGTNAKMSEYACAVTLASLDEWDVVRNEWLELRDWALEISTNADLSVHPAMAKGFVSPYWIVQGSPDRIQRLKEVFEFNQIQSRQWWGSGCHKMKAFKDLAHGDFKMTNELAISTLGLPFFRSISESQRYKIEKVLKNHR
jgi:dTDP-4-amino-4,6-dideoxygalactose transaminase